MKKEIYVDLHNLNENDAYIKLMEVLNTLPNNVNKVIVIHGFHGGNVLKNMVRNQFFHYKILEKSDSLNCGETIFYIDKNKN